METNELLETISNYSENEQKKSKPVSVVELARAAAAIRKSKGFQLLPAERLPGGGLRLQAKVTDAFCFVDRPQVELDASNEKILSFTCGCPAFRLENRFCAHCVALLEEQTEATQLKGAADMAEDGETEAEDEGTDTQPSLEKDPVTDGPGLMDLSYKYSNSRYDLYPLQKDPRIPLERYILVFGDNARAQRLYERDRRWGGNCFGFTSSSAILYLNELEPTLKDFNPNARIPSELSVKDQCQKLELSVLGFIEAMQISQYKLFWKDLTVDELAAAVEAFQKGEGQPVSMGIQRGSCTRDGHSVFPFRLERTQEKEDILHIYDPNNPLKTQYAYLEKNGDSYIHWRYPVTYGKPYDSRYGAILDHVPYQRFADVWQKRGGHPDGNLLLLHPGVALLNDAGEAVARVSKNGVELFSDDVKQIKIKTGGAEDEAVLAVPAGTFQVVVEESEQAELCVQLIGLDLAVDVSTEARQLEVFVDDGEKRLYARIPEENARYALRILSTLDEAKEETLLSGITVAEPMCLLQDYGRLYGSGICADAMLYVNQVNKPLSDIGQLVEQQEQEEQRIRNVGNDELTEP